jgi:hypothetical protein
VESRRNNKTRPAKERRWIKDMLSREYRKVAEAINACKDVDPQIIHGQIVIEVLKRKMKPGSRFEYKEFIRICNQ